ncbi:sugar transporter [Sphingobium sp. AN641]|uniref:sugar transporter n=1 Tax=Sphingobium sp. AN641 TaxID=3133443 RepID=UPI0030BB9E60
MKASSSFIVVGVVILLWNLMGVAAFAMQYSADLAELAKTDPYTARIFAAMPGWAWAAYAVAVGAGTLGAILLLMKRPAAVPLFALSVVAVLAQFGYSFLGTDLLAVKGAGSAIFPAVILVAAIAQYLYARSLVVKGVLR